MGRKIIQRVVKSSAVMEALKIVQSENGQLFNYWINTRSCRLPRYARNCCSGSGYVTM